MTSTANGPRSSRRSRGGDTAAGLFGVQLGEFVLSSGKADFESFQLTEPAFAFALDDASQEVVTDLVRPDRKNEPIRHGRLARVRQWIEAVFDTLKGQLSLEQHGGRTQAGVFARTGQRRLALAAGIWHNWTTGAKIKRSLTAYDH